MFDSQESVRRHTERQPNPVRPVPAMGVEMTVLGTFAATHDGRRLNLGGRRQQLVLAALLIADGRVLPVDRLQELAWSDADQVAGRATLYGYIAELRRAIEPGHPSRAGQLLVRDGPGYALRLSPGHLDAARFTTAVEQGAELLEHGRAGEAVGTLEAGLRLWHGPAYAGIGDVPFVLPEATRLDALRASATELRLTALLELGRHIAVLGELAALVIEQPLRERGWELLALAHYRAGRQGEALLALRRARQRLAAELGVDPGPMLRRLETAILRQEEWLQPPPVSSAGSRPSAAPPAIGRRYEVAAARRRLARSGHVAACQMI